MSTWEQLNMEYKIREILREIQVYDPDHFGYMYMSPYQIAIALDEETRQAIGKPIGGKGTGESSIALYISNQLAKRIKSGEITDIEGAWLAKQNTHEITFKHAGDVITASGGIDAAISMFRLRGE